MSAGTATQAHAPAWLRRWPGLLLCLPAGAAAALAFPPYGVLPGLLGLAAALVLLDLRAPGRPLRSGFVRGWLTGVGYLAVSTSWIGEPFLVDIATHGWQAPFALTLVPGGIGLLWGAAGWMYALLAPRTPAARVLAFASLFAMWEWLRGHMLTGFPWDLPGEVWTAGSALSQAAAGIGIYGLGWIVLAIAAAPAVLAWRGQPRERAGVLAAAALSLAALYVGGALRLRAHPMAGETNGPRVRVVQPNLVEPTTVDRALVHAYLDRYLALSRGPGPRPDVIVWPEGAIPAALDDFLGPHTSTSAQVLAALGPGQVLLLGGYRVEPRGDGGWRYYNTLVALSHGAGGLKVGAVYDKHHLVPFGEYLPFAGVLGPLGLSQVVSTGDGFDAGPAPRPVEIPLADRAFARVQPLICYEALFPSIAEGGLRAAWIVNISDDAWFGRHQGPWQHLNMSAYRAIEEGVPIVRGTPTGVSAMIDPLGRTLRGPAGALLRLAPSRAGVLDARLPAALPPTPFTRLRDGPFWLLVLVGLAPAAIARFRRAPGSC